MTKVSWTEETLIEVVQNSYSIRGVLLTLGLRPAGGNYAQFRKYVREYGLDISHFTSQGWSKGKTLGPNPKIPLEKILVEYSTFNSHKLRIRLLREGYMSHECKVCGNTAWLGNPIPLELDHINGIRTDHRLDNLRLLCPNCHAQTDNYRGKNVGTYR